MKFTKLSLVAALAVSAAFAGGDIAPVEPAVETPTNKCAECGDITGAIKLFYGTDERGAANSLFSKNGAYGDAYADLKYTRKLMDNVTANVGMAYITTLGLENDLVSGTWINHGPSVVDDVAWINAANVAIQLSNTTLVLGRQELATPFFYSEKWSIAANTFDAAVAVNADLPDTTLVAAWVGRGNGTGGGQVLNLNDQNFDGNHNAFSGNNPAYAFGAINKSLSNTTLQAWYYRIPSIAQALWFQGDTKIDSITLGAQYAETQLLATGGADTSAYAFKLGYTADALSAYIAYSKRDNTAAGIDISNIATGHDAGSQSSLYTEAYWNYGHVGGQNASTFALNVGYDFGMAQVAAQYTNVDNGSVLTTQTTGDMTEFALTASTNIGPVNADLAYVYDEVGVAQNAASTVLVMLSLPFSL